MPHEPVLVGPRLCIGARDPLKVAELLGVAWVRCENCSAVVEVRRSPDSQLAWVGVHVALDEQPTVVKMQEEQLRLVDRIEAVRAVLSPRPAPTAAEAAVA